MKFDLTIITPVLNGAGTIARTVDSVLKQDGLKIQYLIMDGGSTDSTCEIAKSYVGAKKDVSIEVHSTKDSGMYQALARGISLAKSNILCYINSDDYFLPNSLASALRTLNADSKIVAVYHDSLVLKNQWVFMNVPQPKSFMRLRLWFGHILYQEGVVFRNVLDAKQIENLSRFRLAGDYALWIYLTLHGKFEKAKGEIAVFALRPGQLSESYEEYRSEMRKVFSSLSKIKSRYILHIWDSFARYLQHLIYRYNLNFNKDYFFGDYGNCSPENAPIVLGQINQSRSLFVEEDMRFLFSSIDTRFGNQVLNYWFGNAKLKYASSAPMYQPSQLKVLYESNYSNSKLPDSDSALVSPYRFYGIQRLERRLLSKIPLERIASRINPNVWGDDSLVIFMNHLRSTNLKKEDKSIRFLEVGSFEGNFLQNISSHVEWKLAGLELNTEAADLCRKKGFEVFNTDIENFQLNAQDEKVDIIYMSQTIEHLLDPVRSLENLARFLSPRGIIYLTTPNYQSRQKFIFGPTWAHWHAPYHRYIFSRKTLSVLASNSQLKIHKTTSHSHGYWSGLSFALNNRGVGGHVSHFSNLDPLTALRATRLALFSNIVWDPVNRGDYLAMTLKRSDNHKKLKLRDRVFV